jgi:hypothetical protein
MQMRALTSGAYLPQLVAPIETSGCNPSATGMSHTNWAAGARKCKQPFAVGQAQPDTTVLR